MPEFVLVDQMPLSSEEENGGPGNGSGGGVVSATAADRDLREREQELVKCPQCQQLQPGFQALKEHLEQAHAPLQHPHPALFGLNGAVSPPPGSAASPPLTPTPTPSTASSNGILPGLPSVLPSVLRTKSGGYACAQCNAAFSTRDQLEKHELVHSPNIQVSCKVCNKTFANVYRLQRHMISHDESAVLRKFKCPECEKAFKFKHHLKEHIRIHSGEKPFECANCGKRFSHSGSYSSHMTSKKCLVMNLKVSRGANPKNGQPLPRNKRAPQINNNNNNSNNNNNNTAFPAIMPKYGEAAAALFSGFPAPPFYPLPGTMGLAPHPYNISHLLEQLQQAGAGPRPAPQLPLPQGLHVGPVSPASPAPSRSRSPSPRPEHDQDHDHDDDGDDRSHDLSAALEVSIEEEEKEENSIKVEREDEDASPEANGQPENEEADELELKHQPVKHSQNGDLESILAKVSANVTKSLFEANMRKMSASPSSAPSSGCPSPAPGSGSDEHLAPSCRHCQRSFSSPIDLHQHERYLCPAAALPELRTEIKREVNVNLQDREGHGLALAQGLRLPEGLAAKLEDVASVAPGQVSGSEEEHELTDHTDHVSEDGRKVRVRSQITDEQLSILKPHYAANPRPKREELTRLAELVALPVRVVQVWFQNTRARDRREGRLQQAPAEAGTGPGPQACALPLALPPSAASSLEQPLDLSTKKWHRHHSLNSSPSSSPPRPSSSNSEDGAMNLSRKSRSPTRSPTPVAMPYRPMYNMYRRSPSPLSWRYLGQKRPFPPDLSFLGLTQHLEGRANSSSPGSDRRSWKQFGPDGEDTPDETEDSASAMDDLSHKRRALGLGVLGPLTAPLLAGFGPPDGSPCPMDNEPEGQFVCKQCDKVFSKQSSLARHKFEHSGQRPHKCDVCPKAFKHKHHLTEHKRLHSGEKPFQCSKCLKRFSHSGSYSQHMNHRYSYCKPYRE